MNLNVTLPTPLAYFAQLVHSDDELPLLEAAATLAHDAYPALDTEQVRDQMDQLSARLMKQLPPGTNVLQRLEVLNRFFFNELGFAANRNDYYNPDNSFVHRVLSTRQGIPISLGVLWMELAQGIGIAARGIGFPGHFLVSVTIPQGLVVLDPATGQSLSREQLSEHLGELAPVDEAGQPIKLDVDACLKPSTPREIVARMLRNLREIHASKADQAQELNVLNRLVLIAPRAVELRLDRAEMLARSGRVPDALVDLDWVVVHADDEAQRRLGHERASQLRVQGANL